MFDQTQVPKIMGKHIAIVLASLCFTPSSQASEIADLLLTNAKVHKHPTADSIAVSKEVFLL